MTISTVTIVGAGYMGGGIAQVLAIAGFDVTIADVSVDTANASLERLQREAREFEEQGLFGTVEDALARIREARAAGVGEVACLIDFGLPAEWNLDEAVAESLALQPNRGTPPEVMADPTIYRFTEALSVYGPALKALIHEEFGDGIMSAINFSVDFARRPDPDGDRVVITLDGKFLDYRW